MGTFIQNIVSDRKLGLFSNFQMALALAQWPLIELKFCLVVRRNTLLNGDPT
jgi:hypothetical protein